VKTEKSGRRAVALVLAAIIVTAVNLRTSVTGFSPLLERIGDDLGFGPSLYGVFGTIVTASFAVFGFAASFLSRRLGLEMTLAGSMLLATLGILFRSLSSSPTGLVLTTIVAFAGVGTANVLIVPIVKRYFAARLKAVSSLYLASLQFGQFLAPLIAVPIALAVGWRMAIGGWAVLTAIACILWAAAAFSNRRAQVGTSGSRGTDEHEEGEERIDRAWRNPILWSMVLMFGMTAMNTYVIITWLPAILTDAGADPAVGGALLALFSIFGLAAAFIVPRLTLNLRNPILIVIVCVALLAIGYAGLLLAPLEGAVIWVVALGLGVSTFPMALTLVNARTRTTSGSSILSGAMQGIGYGIACIGPIIIGVLREVHGSWGSSYVFLFTSLGILLVSGVIACRPHYLEDERPMPHRHVQALATK
jgi:CP family cyanate transporter-like MFS transporter